LKTNVLIKIRVMNHPIPLSTYSISLFSVLFLFTLFLPWHLPSFWII
jgi:predicted membrane chloride channel (bestrophin family)